MQENDLQVEDLQKVTAITHPHCSWRKEMITPEDLCFNVSFLMACAAYGIERVHWHDSEIMQEPRLLEFAQRVDHIAASEEGLNLEEVSRAQSFFEMTGAEVIAKGKTFREVGNCKDGVCTIRRMTDEELIQKFTENASEVLPLDRISKVVQTVLELEKLENVSEFMRMVTP